MTTTTILTTAEILSNNRVTREQVSKVTFKNRGAEVESASGNGIYYVRKYLDRNILVCCCPAAEVGNSCWHVRATLAKLQLLAVEKRIAASYEQAAAIEADPQYQEDYREAHSCGCGGR